MRAAVVARGRQLMTCWGSSPIATSAPCLRMGTADFAAMSVRSAGAARAEEDIFERCSPAESASPNTADSANDTKAGSATVAHSQTDGQRPAELRAAACDPEGTDSPVVHYRRFKARNPARKIVEWHGRACEHSDEVRCVRELSANLFSCRRCLYCLRLWPRKVFISGSVGQRVETHTHCAWTCGLRYLTDRLSRSLLVAT